MTNREAIGRLRESISFYDTECPKDKVSKFKWEQMQKLIEVYRVAIAALEKQENDSWILADDIPPKFPCLTVDGMGNYPKAWHSIVTITDEHGKKLYFTDDIFHFGMVDKAYKPIICEQNAIKWWKPLDRPE